MFMASSSMNVYTPGLKFKYNVGKGNFILYNYIT